MTLDAPKTAAKLNDKVSRAGQGHGLHRRGRSTGPRSGGAWSAQVRYPDLVVLVLLVAARRRPASQEIAHGTAATGGGRRRSPSSSSAKPDLSVPEKDEPTFQFTRLRRRDRHDGRDALGAARRSTWATRRCRRR